MTRISLPDSYPSGECVLVPIDVSLVPLISGALIEFTEKRTWTHDGYENGYRAFQEVLLAMASPCFTQLAQEIRDLRGVMPAYASVPIEDRTSDMYNSLNDTMAQITDLRGIQDDGWFSDTLGTISQLVQTQRGNTQSTGFDLWSTVATLLSEGSAISVITSTIAGFLETQEQTAVEGGLLMALIAIEAANTAALQQLAINQVASLTQMTGVLEALRGSTAPADNILEAIRGTTEASETRNVVELLA